MSDNLLKLMQKTSYLSGGNSAYLEEMFENYLNNPQEIPADWRECFDQMPQSNGQDVSHAEIREQFKQLAKQKTTSVINVAGSGSHDVEKERKQAHVSGLINAYRSHGHHHAKLDPLNTKRALRADLELAYHQLSESDFVTEFSCNSFIGINKSEGSLKEIFEALNAIYCHSVGIEYMHITETEETLWLQQRIEPNCCRPQFDTQKKQEILKQLVSAEELERYLGKKYVGQKRFSLEGGESLIPMLQEIIHRGGTQQVKETVIGMAHRGRLNVLVNVLGKAPSTLFQEFEGKYVDDERTGDVKYHLGFSSDVITAGGGVHLVLGFNPSHLEIISPVIEGSVRARQERRGDAEHSQVIPVIIHGDAAFAGQGVVMETFNMSQARGYRTGGTVHIVINNQIGFTTSNPLDSRSTLYCTDVAKMVQAPIFHVNADDPEAVVFVTQIALDYRMKFNKDVVIDLVCYRRHGHNESDEPMITQPLMYQSIRQHASTVALYSEQLQQQKVISEADHQAMIDVYRANLDAGHSVLDSLDPAPQSDFAVDWGPYLDKEWTEAVDTSISVEKLNELAIKILQVPQGFNVQRQVARELENRRKMLSGEVLLNWGCAETMAYASLLDAGHPVRISGQDSCRGTFSHRHAVFHDCENGVMHTPLANIKPDQAKFTVIDSFLSEEGVLGFEYGYTTAEPSVLVIWEGQFGDFVNGAQVVIDQFISSGEQKWGRLCGLTLFLPHGYEGMGPEHSSARLERFLQLCAQHNMQVCVPTTPAQCFHMIRRQALRKFRKPLIVMTPKSLLRHKAAVSPLEDLTSGKFHLVIPEVDTLAAENVKRVVMCSGKVYYDLLDKRRESNRQDVAIVRIEQLYPFPKNELHEQLEKYPNAKDVVWCQEEPQNQGAWFCSRHNFQVCLLEGQRLLYAGRESTAAPAVGYLSLHKAQQAALVADALG